MSAPDLRTPVDVLLVPLRDGQKWRATARGTDRTGAPLTVTLEGWDRGHLMQEVSNAWFREAAAHAEVALSAMLPELRRAVHEGLFVVCDRELTAPAVVIGEVLRFTAVAS